MKRTRIASDRITCQKESVLHAKELSRSTAVGDKKRRQERAEAARRAVENDSSNPMKYGTLFMQVR